jgi:ribosomal protein L16 Arg81 hydroxylase
MDAIEGVEKDMTLAEVLAPMTVHDFLDSYLGRQWLLIRGDPNKFERLFSWTQLNEALSSLRADSERVHLVRAGRRIPRETYIHVSSTGRASYLIGPAVVEHVKSGATLVVNQVEELFREVRTLAESCEDVCRIYVPANLYAGWRTDRGFNVHWDRHDTLIVQMLGRKAWTVWRPTRQHPLPTDSERLIPRPSENPDWDGVLEQGDMLYMPRGFWHVASPLDELSLHLTFGLRHHTGLDLLEWVIARLHEYIEIRRDVPHWANENDKSEWIRAIRAAFLTAFDDDVVTRFTESRSGHANVRPTVRLPLQIKHSESEDFGLEGRLRLWPGLAMRLGDEPSNGMMSLGIGDLNWQCASKLRPALALLDHSKGITLAEMSEQVDVAVRPFLKALMTALVSARAVWSEC